MRRAFGCRQVRCFATKTLQEMWAAGASVTEVAEESCARAAAADRNEWIHLIPKNQVLERAEMLEKRAASMSQEQRQQELPLLGTTFAVKDNLMVKDVPSTNAMDLRPPRRAPIAHESAAVVEKLQDHGALVIGKTNKKGAAIQLRWLLGADFYWPCAF